MSRTICLHLNGDADGTLITKVTTLLKDKLLIWLFFHLFCCFHQLHLLLIQMETIILRKDVFNFDIRAVFLVERFQAKFNESMFNHLSKHRYLFVSLLEILEIKLFWLLFWRFQLVLLCCGDFCRFHEVRLLFLLAFLCCPVTTSVIWEGLELLTLELMGVRSRRERTIHH